MKKKTDDKTLFEIKDFVMNLRRYLAVNDNDVCFVGSFMSFKKRKKKTDDDLIVAFGPKEILRDMLNDLRNMVEDEADKDNFVSV